MTSLYERQLRYIFDRPVEEPAWYWTDYWEAGVFDEDAGAAFDFIERLLPNIKADLSPFSDSQIGMGIDFIFNNSLSNLTHDFQKANVSYERKEKTLRSIFRLFQDIFEPRCEPVLSSYSQGMGTRINGVCYMFWDVTPLSDWGGFNITADKAIYMLENVWRSDVGQSPAPEELKKIVRRLNPPFDASADNADELIAEIRRQYKTVLKMEGEGYYAAVADVMRRCLGLKNPACVESALHGLGHMVFTRPKMAVPVIDQYLKNGKDQRKELLAYARQARTGMIL